MKRSKLNKPSLKNLIQLDFKTYKKKPILKNKLKGIKKSGGRNYSGKITVRHKGGGHKRRYRKLTFLRNYDSTSMICSIEYDPNRNSNIASIYDINSKTFHYIIAPKSLKTGDIVRSGTNIEPKLGSSLPISEIPIGSYIHNVSVSKSKTGKLTRAAGTFSKLKEKTLESARIELSSGENKYISPQCYGTIGIVSNEFFFLNQLRKAGQSRWLNKRPTVRGVAMNPIDHPHGGGEGKKSGKGKTPWGRFVKKGSTKK